MRPRRVAARAALLAGILGLLPTARPARAAGLPPGYPFAAEVHAALDAHAAADPGRVQRAVVGTSVEGRPLVALTVADPTRPIGRRMLVVANIHAMEWIGTNITPKLRHTERTHGFLLRHLSKADVRREGLTGEEISWASRISFMMSS